MPSSATESSENTLEKTVWYPRYSISRNKIKILRLANCRTEIRIWLMMDKIEFLSVFFTFMPLFFPENHFESISRFNFL